MLFHILLSLLSLRSRCTQSACLSSLKQRPIRHPAYQINDYFSTFSVLSSRICLHWLARTLGTRPLACQVVTTCALFHLSSQIEKHSSCCKGSKSSRLQNAQLPHPSATCFPHSRQQLLSLSCCMRTGYLRQQSLPMVVVSHDREFLDQLCNKIVETEFGVTSSYAGNYTQFVGAKDERIAQQWLAYEKQQKEIQRQVRAHSEHG